MYVLRTHTHTHTHTPPPHTHWSREQQISKFLNQVLSVGLSWSSEDPCVLNAGVSTTKCWLSLVPLVKSMCDIQIQNFKPWALPERLNGFNKGRASLWWQVVILHSASTNWIIMNEFDICSSLPWIGAGISFLFISISITLYSPLQGGTLPHSNESLYIGKFFSSLATSLEQFISLFFLLFLPSSFLPSSTICKFGNIWWCPRAA